MTKPTPFTQKKQAILASLSAPKSSYTDASPKGSIDEPIRDLIVEINSYADLVTTSSCSGRVSVFLEGSGSGGKGSSNGTTNGSADPGRWLYVSHGPIDPTILEPEALASGRKWHKLFGLTHRNELVLARTSTGMYKRHVHFKFEPMILHILCATAAAADTVLKCAQQAGFRESGASNVPGAEDVPVNVAVRTTGLALDSIIGGPDAGLSEGVEDAVEKGECKSSVDEEYLDMLIDVANARFKTSKQRQERFGSLLREKFGKLDDEVWEDTAVRRERKKAEGMARQQTVRDHAAKDRQPHDAFDNGSLTSLDVPY